WERPQGAAGRFDVGMDAWDANRHSSEATGSCFRPVSGTPRADTVRPAPDRRDFAESRRHVPPEPRSRCAPQPEGTPRPPASRHPGRMLGGLAVRFLRPHPVLVPAGPDPEEPRALEWDAVAGPGRFARGHRRGRRDLRVAGRPLRP